MPYPGDDPRPTAEPDVDVAPAEASAVGADGPEVEWAEYPQAAVPDEARLPAYVPPAGRPDPVTMRSPMLWAFFAPVLVAVPVAVRAAIAGSLIELAAAAVLAAVSVAAGLVGLTRRARLHLDGEGLTVDPVGPGRGVHLPWARLRGVEVVPAGLRWLPADPSQPFPAPCARDSDGWWRLSLGTVDPERLAAVLAAYGPPRAQPPPDRPAPQ